MQEMLHNLDTAFPIPHPPPSDGSVGPGFQIMIDEIKVEGRMRWDPRFKHDIGIAEALHAGLAKNTVHLASEATVAAISSFSNVPTRNVAHPFIIAPTCKRESTNDQRILLEAARDAANAKAAHIGGRPYCISSDGDNRRRNATIFLPSTARLTAMVPCSRNLTSPLFDYHCGLDDLTGNIDIKHILKRLRNTLIRLLASTIDGVVLLRELIKQHLLRDSRHSAQHIDKLLNPNDRQNVKLMYDLMSAIAVLPEAKEADTPTFKNTRRILRLLGCLYRHILEAYTNIKLSLHDQLVHISAAMHLMLALYNKEAGRFVPSQTYFDFMTAGKNLFFCVAKTQIDDPDGQFWIISPGSDPLEKTFGQVRTITGSDSNADMSQLGNRLSAAAECDNILAEHPEWARDARRLRLPVWQDTEGDVSAKIDHITPRSWLGDVHVKGVSIRTTWMNGRGIAEDELTALLEPPFESMLIDLNAVTVPQDTLAATDSDTRFLPDMDDMAQEVVADLDSPALKGHDAYLTIPDRQPKAAQGNHTSHLF
ncbi:hypothetical protein B0H13DRAFT_2662175 [Mycena leptocephala]|nr:hypothetical protein B0H13DRAFT_2662175 [Mycena leptocephala]